MKAKFVFVGAVMLLTMTGCQSAPVKITETVLERSGHADKRPDWINESEPVKMSDVQMTSIGFATIPENFNLERGYETAESSAKKGIIRELQKRLQKATPASEDQADVISNKAVHSLSEKIQRTSQYWEKVSAHPVGSSASKDFKFNRVYTQVSLSKADLKFAMTGAVASATSEEGVGKLPQESAKAVLSESPNLLAKVVVAKPKRSFREVASISGAFTVQVYAFGRESRAKRITRQLKGKGLEAFYSYVEVDGHQVFRVEVGQYSSRSTALKATAEVKKKGELEAVFVQKTE